jgi:hypothetical protein
MVSSDSLTDRLGYIGRTANMTIHVQNDLAEKFKIWEMIVSAILRKGAHMNMFLILIGYLAS